MMNLLVYSGRNRITGVLAVLVALCISLTFTTPAFSADPEPPQVSPEVESLAARAEGGEMIDVIIGLRTGFTLEGELEANEVTDQRENIAADQEALAKKLQGMGVPVRRKFRSIPYVATSIDAATLEVLRKSPLVSSIELDQELYPQLYESTTQIGADGAGGAWALGYTGAGYSVAVLDSGVQKDHPFLTGKVIAEACFSTNGTSGSITYTSYCPGGENQSTAVDSGLPCPLSDCYHGTHVAGIAAGKDGVSGGHTFSGVAKGANIVAVQIFRDKLSGTTHTKSGLASDMIAALEYIDSVAVTYSVAAVNLSVGSSLVYSSTCDSISPSTKAAVDSLKSKGVATVISSGNFSSSTGLSYPACISSAISVGNVDKSDMIQSTSNSASFLSLLAPGMSIYSSITGSTYNYLSGTSMASPHVTGAWAVVKQAHPGYSVDQVLGVLSDSGKPITDTRNSYVFPRIFVKDALDYLLVKPDGLTATLTSPDPVQIDLSWNDQSDNEDGFRAERKVNSGDWQTVGTTTANAETYQDTSLPAASLACGNTVFYRVRTIENVNGYESLPSNEASIVMLPCAPDPVSLTVRSQHRIRIDWSDTNLNETAYRVEWSPDGSGSWAQVGADLAVNSMTLDQTAIPCATMRYYRVKGVNSSGATSSLVQHATTNACVVPAAPSGFGLADYGALYVDLEWEDVFDDETGYEIWRSPDGTSGWVAIDTLVQDQVTYRDLSVSSGVHYFYRIKSINEWGASAAVPVTPVEVFTPFGRFIPFVLGPH